MTEFKEKYLKYKTKYLELKAEILNGGKEIKLFVNLNIQNQSPFHKSIINFLDQIDPKLQFYEIEIDEPTKPLSQGLRERRRLGQQQGQRQGQRQGQPERKPRQKELIGGTYEEEYDQEYKRILGELRNENKRENLGKSQEQLKKEATNETNRIFQDYEDTEDTEDTEYDDVRDEAKRQIDYEIQSTESMPTSAPASALVVVPAPSVVDPVALPASTPASTPASAQVAPPASPVAAPALQASAPASTPASAQVAPPASPVAAPASPPASQASAPASAPALQASALVSVPAPPVANPVAAPVALPASIPASPVAAPLAAQVVAVQPKKNKVQKVRNFNITILEIIYNAEHPLNVSDIFSKKIIDLEKKINCLNVKYVKNNLIKDMTSFINSEFDIEEFNNNNKVIQKITFDDIFMQIISQIRDKICKHLFGDNRPNKKSDRDNNIYYFEKKDDNYNFKKFLFKIKEIYYSNLKQDNLYEYNNIYKIYYNNTLEDFNFPNESAKLTELNKSISDLNKQIKEKEKEKKLEIEEIKNETKKKINTYKNEHEQKLKEDKIIFQRSLEGKSEEEKKKLENNHKYSKVMKPITDLTTNKYDNIKKINADTKKIVDKNNGEIKTKQTEIKKIKETIIQQLTEKYKIPDDNKFLINFKLSYNKK